jgi:hypothetical protein
MQLLSSIGISSEWFILLKFSLIAIALVLASIPVSRLHRKFRSKLMDFYMKRYTAHN